jgi:hypothetical protein
MATARQQLGSVFAFGKNSCYAHWGREARTHSRFHFERRRFNRGSDGRHRRPARRAGPCLICAALAPHDSAYSPGRGVDASTTVIKTEAAAKRQFLFARVVSGLVLADGGGVEPGRRETLTNHCLWPSIQRYRKPTRLSRPPKTAPARHSRNGRNTAPSPHLPQQRAARLTKFSLLCTVRQSDNETRNEFHVSRLSGCHGIIPT